MRMHLHPHRAKVGAPTLVAARPRACGAADDVPEPGEADPVAVAEAALAGWLQADGFVGQYEHGTNRSLTIEFQVADDDECLWVARQPATSRCRTCTTTCATSDAQDELARAAGSASTARCCAPSSSAGTCSRAARRSACRAQLFTASHDEVVAYLRSIFQADGYVSVRRDNGYEKRRVGFAVIGERWTEDVQLLLNMLGIYSRRTHKAERRADRHDLHEVAIGIGSERARFAELVGFVGARQAGEAARVAGAAQPEALPATSARRRSSRSSESA